MKMSVNEWPLSPVIVRPFVLPKVSEIKVRSNDGGRGMFTPEVEALGKSYFGDSFNKDALRLLPYIWNRVNETDGVLDVCRINVEEFYIILKWRDKGFLEIVGRGSTNTSFNETPHRLDRHKA